MSSIKQNNISLVFDSKSENEMLSRMVISGFLLEADPTIEELNDIKTSVSEAVTNAIIHGYNSDENKQIEMKCLLKEELFETEKIYEISIAIKDYGIGIADIEKAREPMYTTKPEMERSGMGFMFMEMFMDKVEVISKINAGTTVNMRKKIVKRIQNNDE